MFRFLLSFFLNLREVKRSVPALSTLISLCRSVQGTVPTSGVTPVSLDNGTTIVGPNCLLDSDSFSFIFLSIDRARKRKDRLLIHAYGNDRSLSRGRMVLVRKPADEGWLTARCQFTIERTRPYVAAARKRMNARTRNTALPSSASCVPLLIPLPSALLPPAGATVSPPRSLPSLSACAVDASIMSELELTGVLGDQGFVQCFRNFFLFLYTYEILHCQTLPLKVKKKVNVRV